MARASSRWMKGGTAMALARVLMPVLDGHPDVFERQWPLRVADIDRYGRLRLDAAARHIQDVGQDHVHDWVLTNPIRCGWCAAP
jgi:acyl-ACP thioesterase